MWAPRKAYTDRKKLASAARRERCTFVAGLTNCGSILAIAVRLKIIYGGNSVGPRTARSIRAEMASDSPPDDALPSIPIRLEHFNDWGQPPEPAMHRRTQAADPPDASSRQNGYGATVPQMFIVIFPAVPVVPLPVMSITFNVQTPLELSPQSRTVVKV